MTFPANPFLDGGFISVRLAKSTAHFSHTDQLDGLNTPIQPLTKALEIINAHPLTQSRLGLDYLLPF
jgi:hypothetical protein